MSDSELRNFFKFSEGDLAANRMGNLSEAQKKRLIETERSTSRTFRGLGWMLVLIAIFVSLLLLNEARKIGWADLPSMIPALSIVWLICGLFAWGFFAISRTKTDHSLQKVEGEVNFVKVEKQVSTGSSTGPRYRTEQQYELRVGKVKFEDVDEELLNTIEEGDTYIFYYTKDNKDILSCEFIKRGK